MSIKPSRAWRAVLLALLALLLALTGGALIVTSARADGRGLYERLAVLAQQGHAEAAYHQGMLLNNGIGVAQDLPKALALFEGAAAKGDALAAYKAGCYHAGQFPGVVPLDETRALAYKLAAAEAGYALAQYDVAQHLYRQGDLEKAYRWAQRGADQGDPGSLMALASMHFTGRGAPKDAARAYTNLRLAVRVSGSATPRPVEDHLARLASELSDPQRAAIERELAAWQPRPSALTVRAGLGVRAAHQLVETRRP